MEDREKNRLDRKESSTYHYLNTYDGNKFKVNLMKQNVWNDLDPFYTYIRICIDNARNMAKVGAKCFEVKQKLVLKPLFSLINVVEADSFTIKKPNSSYAILDWDEDWGNIEKFDAITKGRKTIWVANEIIDNYKKKIIFQIKEDIDFDSSYLVFLNDDNYFKCTLRKLDYSNINDYRVVASNTEILSSNDNGDTISFGYNGILPSKIKMFDKIECDVLGKSSLDFDRNFKMEKFKIKVFNKKEGTLLIGCDDSELSDLFYENNLLQYAQISRADICKLLNDKDISYSKEDNKIELLNNKYGVNGENIEIKGLKFKIDSPLENVKYKLKDKDGKNIGTFVEIEEDENYSNDIYSNVSYFFKESTDQLTDTQDNNGKKYIIGSRYERFNQLEICEVVGKKRVPLEKIPEKLYVEPNTRQLDLQSHAINVLRFMPRKEHLPLLNLMESKSHAEWKNFYYEDIEIPKWFKLTNSNYEGCDSQREFVKKTIATPDFAILEGPPGSGKTTTILEIIAQAITNGEKVMLAASTNAAIDNILERIETLPKEITDKMLAVRLGSEYAVSESVNNYALFNISDKDLSDEIIRRANLVCGTMIGILQHPDFKLKYNFSVSPIFDYLIVDEASKTTLQEFLVPAIFAKKWILSGDLKQLTPYIEQDSIESSLAEIKEFNVYAQQAQSILMLLRQNIYRSKNPILKNMRFCICVDDKIVDAVKNLLADYPSLKICMISNIKNNYSVSVDEFIEGTERAVLIYGAQIIFVTNEDYDKIKNYLPEDYLPIFNSKKSLLDLENNCKYSDIDVQIFSSKIKTLKELKENLTSELKNKKWAQEIAWRLCRVQELFLLDQLEDNHDDKSIERYNKQIEERIPYYAKEPVMKTINLLKQIALPSIIQLLQQGVSDTSKSKITTLNSGFDEYDFSARHTIVAYQHRMHNDISKFSAKYIYEGQALNNGTVIDRKWNYKEYPSRTYWLHVNGKINKGRNQLEALTIVEEIKKFIKFAKENPKKDGTPWTVACLTYYRAQESELKLQIQKLLREARTHCYYKVEDANVEIVVYTVDKFQGNEADIVFLSMIKTGDVNLGFMDSPNRLNVALTRAKYQIVLVGDKEYFKSNKCKSNLLKHVVEDYNI